MNSLQSVSPAVGLPVGPVSRLGAAIPANPPITPAKISLISEAEFDKRFAKVRDIKPERFGSVISLGQKKMKTTTCATCLGITARGYDAQNKLTRIGLHHFNEGIAFTEFLAKMVKKQKKSEKITAVFLSICGGYDNSNYLTLKSILKTTRYGAMVKVAEKRLNPWNMPKNWDRVVDEFELEKLDAFSVKMGVDQAGEIFVADEKGYLSQMTDLVPQTKDFVQYAQITDSQGVIKQNIKTRVATLIAAKYQT